MARILSELQQQYKIDNHLIGSSVVRLKRLVQLTTWSPRVEIESRGLETDLRNPLAPRFHVIITLLFPVPIITRDNYCFEISTSLDLGSPKLKH